MDIRKHLPDNNLYCEAYEHENGCISAAIEWGDWKHDHKYLEYLMGELDYILVDEKITNADGSDCYSADHYYRKA